jgi:nucleosome binding factor SPN SPT16 subunit
MHWTVCKRLKQTSAKHASILYQLGTTKLSFFFSSHQKTPFLSHSMQKRAREKDREIDREIDRGRERDRQNEQKKGRERINKKRLEGNQKVYQVAYHVISSIEQQTHKKSISKSGINLEKIIQQCQITILPMFLAGKFSHMIGVGFCWV